MRDVITVVFKGAAMGVAEIIPGVSGGTIALIVGIYDRLVEAIASLRPAPLRHLPYLHHRGHRRKLANELHEMDVHFLLTLGIGMAAMIISLARVIEHVLETYPGVTYAFFGGLIFASAIVLYRQVEVDSPQRVALGLIVIVVAFVLSGLTPTGFGHSLPVIFIAGAIAITALVLPGVSGSFLLIALGQYEYMIGSLNDFVDAIVRISGETFVETSPPVLVFLAGASIGLLSVAHVVNYALEHAREATLLVLISLMVGALRVPGQEVLKAQHSTPIWLVTVLLAALVGAASILVFDYYTEDLKY